MRSLVLLTLAAASLWGCADPSEIQALRARKSALEAERSAQRQIAADAALYRDALRKVPEAGMSLDPGEVTARVTKATTGVAVSVERTASGGVDVSLSGPATPARAAVTLEQLAQYLPDVSLRSASLRGDGFTAKGSAEKPAPATAPAARGETSSIVPFTEARKLREEVAVLERAVAEAKLSEDVVQRGPAALRALQSPDAFRQQAALVQKVVALSTTVELTFEPGNVTARGSLLPGRKVIDGLPLVKSDYEVLSMSENAGHFELKLQSRATGR
ncbi:MAG TPA: hypothetical protein VFA20_19635 [Myxococcaceae bacterium]|nr:hypothetical protein [Myxococcaceae bacterium]